MVLSANRLCCGVTQSLEGRSWDFVVAVARGGKCFAQMQIHFLRDFLGRQLYLSGFGEASHGGALLKHQ